MYAFWTSSFWTNLKDPILSLYMHGKTGEGCCCLNLFLNLQPPNPVPQPLWLHQPLCGWHPGDKVLHLEVRGWGRQEPWGLVYSSSKVKQLCTYVQTSVNYFHKTSPGGRLIHWSTSIQPVSHVIYTAWQTCEKRVQCVQNGQFCPYYVWVKPSRFGSL